MNTLWRGSGESHAADNLYSSQSALAVCESRCGECGDAQIEGIKEFLVHTGKPLMRSYPPRQTASTMRNLLIIYTSRTQPNLATHRDYLLSFRRYATDCRSFCVNVSFGGVPSYLRKVKFDLIIFNSSFVGDRASRNWFVKAMERIANTKEFQGVRVAMPQDEFTSMDLMCDFINEFKIDVVFSVAPESEWKKIYRTVDFNRVKFIRLLTGYLDERVIRKWSKLVDSYTPRSIDIGYRVVSRATWGRFNLMKGKIAEIFEDAARHHNLRTDIAVGWEHFKLGNDWLAFLSNCRFTIGIEGGSTLLDWNGTLSEAISAYLSRNPQADFDELERVCIPPGKDGEIAVFAMSPRHLEACLTRTGQVLVEGEYNGVLRPYDHYIPLRKDFSNLEEVLEIIKDEPRRRDMVERAFLDIVKSDKYTYRHMVGVVLDALPENRTGHVSRSLNSCVESFLYGLNGLSYMVDTSFVWFYSRARDVRNALRRGLLYLRSHVLNKRLDQIF
jgi:hypothetical protein